MYDLKNKTVLISGVSSGIGRKFAEVLITKYDCKVYGIARNEAKILEFKASLNEKSENFKGYYLFDVSEETAWENLAKTLDSDNIKIDVVINCAGYLPDFKKFDGISTHEFKKVMETDFFSCVYSVKYLTSIVKTSDTPAVINISSSSALATFSGISGYSSAKSALKNFTLVLAEEYRNQIFFSCVCPGFTYTDIFSRMNLNEKESNLIKKFSSSPDKIVKKTLRKIKRKKKLIVVGYDAKFMSLFYKLAPNLTSKIITNVLKKSKLEMFDKL